MVQINNFTNNDDVRIVDAKGAFQIVEYRRDLSVTPATAMTAFFCNEMNVRKRQLVCDVSKSGITCQAGAMQWMAGNVFSTTGVKGMGDLIGKAFRGKVTGESAIKPEYTGSGTLVLEPTYKHIILLDTSEWNGAVVLDDGLFLACESQLSLNHCPVLRFFFAVPGFFHWPKKECLNMASIEIKATRMDKTVTFDLPCREKELEEQLSVLYGTPPSHAVIEVEQVAYPRELGMLTGKMLDLDALNYLARRIDGFDYLIPIPSSTIWQRKPSGSET